MNDDIMYEVENVIKRNQNEIPRLDIIYTTKYWRGVNGNRIYGIE